jgi:hypothetical protein
MTAVWASTLRNESGTNIAMLAAIVSSSRLLIPNEVVIHSALS